MKLDINRAWTDALNLIQTNFGVVSIVAGVFFFLPYLAFALFMPDMATSMTIEPDGSGDPSAMIEQMSAIYADIWWIMLLLVVAQTVGTLALLALLRAENRPTVGEAIVTGIIGMLTYLVAMIVVYIGFGLVGGIALGGAIAADVTALAVILVIALFIGLIYVAVKFSMLAPVISIERKYNPFAAMMRSWKLTKGNSLRLFAFFFLLFVAIIVVSIVIGLIVTLVFGLMGPEIMLIGSGIANAALQALYLVLMLGVLAAIHRQLAGPDTEALSETFE